MLRLFLAFLFLATPALADPIITPIVLTAATGAIGVATGLVTTGAALLSVGATALAAVVSYTMRKNTGDAQSTASNSANEVRNIPISQSVPPRLYAYGSVRTGGCLFFEENVNPWLYVGVALSDGVIESVDTLFFADVSIPLDATGVPVSGNTYFGKLALEWANGSDTQAASPMLLAAVPSTIDSTFRQRKVARAVVKMNWGTDSTDHTNLWGNSVSPSFQVRGVRVYDPRDTTQSLGDPTTWRYSDNPALCIAHALTHAWGVELSTDDIDWSTVSTAANICDTKITYNGALVSQFVFAGIFQSGLEIGSQLQDMLGAMRGKITYRNGKYGLVADQARYPVATVVDDDILEITDVSLAGEGRTIFNAISASFYDAQNGGRKTTTDVYELDDAIDAEGLRETSVDLPFTATSWSAQIIAYRELIETRDGRTIGMRLIDPYVYVSPGDVIAVSSNANSFMNGNYTVIQVDLADVGVMITARGYDPDAYADPSTYLV